MKIIKVKSDSIAHLSYLIIDDDEACVIDPRRQAQIYFEKAQENGATIKYIFETHRNEDFVTGSRELRRLTGAPIYHGKGLDFDFGQFAQEGDEFLVGGIKIKAIETPGHTPESLSYALYAKKNNQSPVGVFTGDALFVNDVGRTDFFPDELEKYAGLLYDSLHNKILPLGDHVVLYPAHGAGSVCGGGIADREVSTLGHEKTYSPMLKLGREEFINKKVKEKHQMPPYFKKMEKVNLKGDDSPLRNYDSFKLLSVDEVKEDVKRGDGIVLDVRSPEAHLGCHVPGSLCVPVAMLGAYAGYFLKYNAPITLIADDISMAHKARFNLKLLGYDNIKGMLNGGIQAWETSGERLERSKIIDVKQVKGLEKTNEADFIDVRKPEEWEEGIISDATKIFLGDLPKKVDKIDKARPKIIYCGSGARATIAASLLQREGAKNLKVFMGSMQAYKAWD